MKLRCKDGQLRRFVLSKNTRTKMGKCLDCNQDFAAQESAFADKIVFKEHVCNRPIVDSVQFVVPKGVTS